MSEMAYLVLNVRDGCVTGERFDDVSGDAKSGVSS